MPAYPAGYMVYPNQFIPGQPPMPQPPTSQGQQHQPYGNPYNLGGAGHQLQYPHTPDSKVPLAEGPQVVPTDPVSAKASFEPTVYMNYPNYPSRSNPEPQTNAPPSYESHDFTPQVPARLPKKPPVFPHGMAVSGPGHPHTMGSVQKSSDSESMRTNEQGKNSTLRKISNLLRISNRCPFKKLKKRIDSKLTIESWLLILIIKYCQIYPWLHFLNLLICLN